MLFSTIFHSFWAPLWGWIMLILWALYLTPIVVSKLFLKPLNIKKKYNTDWVLVTGASSGIGAELSKQLAEQGLNVVLVALKDKLLEEQTETLKNSYPKQEFRAIGVDLTDINSEKEDSGYMAVIRKETKDLDIGAVFSNAGFFMFENFDRIPLEKHVGHMECNAMAGLKLTHHFFGKWKKEKRRGLIVYTISSAAFFVSPYAPIYGASKAFLKSFVESFAIEARHHNIDVLGFSPQYTRTKLYDKTMKLGILDLFAMFGSEPKDVAYTCLCSAGRFSHREQGAYSIVMKIFGGLMFDTNWLSPIISLALKLAPEYKKLK